MLIPWVMYYVGLLQTVPSPRLIGKLCTVYLYQPLHCFSGYTAETYLAQLATDFWNLQKYLTACTVFILYWVNSEQGMYLKLNYVSLIFNHS